MRRHTWVPPYIILFCRAGPVCPAVGAVRYRRRGEGTPPYGGLQEVRCAGRCGERTERCQWQRKRSERVAAVKISSVRRKAAQKFWAPQQDHRPLRKRIMGCVGEGLSCPPLCRPIPGHCRARQSGHFLETGLLHPPLAALRRFPLPRATARVAPTEGYRKCGGAGRCRHRPLRKRNTRCNGRATAGVAPTEGYKECLAGGRTGASAPTDMWKRLRRAGLQEVSQNGPSGTPAPTGGVLMVPYAAGHMGPALHYIIL